MNTLHRSYVDGLRYNDSHFHLTNYIQEGITPQRFLEIMGDKTPRSTLFGIPLQQQWSHRVTGDVAPKYYLESDADLYYYSFTDAYIAHVYSTLSPEQQKRFDPMITGFNPTDMYAADHIKRVLTMYPGVFTGIGEFTIHKEFVSSKIAGDVASLKDPALDRILDFAAETGLLVILHSDMSVPFVKPELEHYYLDQMKKLFADHRDATIIWAHTGLGRIVKPISDHAASLEAILKDSKYRHVYFDISWDEVAKYLVASEQSIKETADLINRYPDRFLFGSDTVAPESAEAYHAVFEVYSPLIRALTPEASKKLRLENYERLFDAAAKKVRSWEAKNINS